METVHPSMWTAVSTELLACSSIDALQDAQWSVGCTLCLLAHCVPKYRPTSVPDQLLNLLVKGIRFLNLLVIAVLLHHS